ncbi:trypsin-like peptidase [Bodo saltans virus]|uniref:Trypsin-like peptidase n=1 Tax=Bodo saltans virus TaxID=2024608 RepID=A0A2H4UUS8_9VIRU|nr:trypsin-like peptidase [Bodo saltans virus]ATZ80681.1 trypsin-like peptidase [Bodo saltans virus]
MSCFVFSEGYIYDIAFWNNIHENERNLSENNINDIAKKEFCKNTGNGSIIKINDKIYVLTCYHILLDSDKIYVNIVDRNDLSIPIKFKMKIVFCVEFLDLALLEFCESDYNFEKIKMYTIENFMMRMTEIEMVKNFNINFINEKNEMYTFNLKYMYTEEINYISDFIAEYKIPFYKFTLLQNNEYQLQGLSGSIITNCENMAVGMICIAKELKYIYAFPSILLMKCICSFLDYNIYSPRLIVFDNDIVIDVDDTGKEIGYGLQIKNDFGIDYQTVGKKKFMFKKNDVIININGYSITKSGYIYDEEYGMNMSIRTFAMFKNIFDNFLKIKYIRDEIENECIINGIDLQSYTAFNFISQKIEEKFIFCDGFIFIELTEKIIKYFRNKKIYIDDSILRNIINCDGKKKKFVVLVYIDFNFLEKTNKESFKNLKKNGYPYKNNKLMILQKVANEEVMNLNSLKKILTKNKTNKIKTYSFY